MRERHGNFFRGSEAVFAIKNHRVRAVEHQDRGAGRLIFALVHLQVAVFDVERQGEALALDGARERGRNIEVKRVAEFVGAGSAAGFDAGREVAGVVTSKAGFAERAEQGAQRLEAEEVEALVGDFKFSLWRVLADLAADAGWARGIGRLFFVWTIDGDVGFLPDGVHQSRR